jgi:serine/threonine-protein kinase
MSSNEDVFDGTGDTGEATHTKHEQAEPISPSHNGAQSEASAAPVYPVIPPSGGQTVAGTAPVPHWPLQASVIPPSQGLATVATPSAAPPALEAQSASSEQRTPLPRGVLAPGELFGVYRVGQCIGEGGMARIYQAEHTGLRRQVALKVLLDASTRAPEGRERFLREARIAAAIKHPNVVNIFDVGVHEDTAFLVMELLNGTDLERLIEERGALDEGTLVDIMVPVIAGLAAVHDAGVVHRDLKPGNVFLAQGVYDEVDPKLLDFGICKAPGPEQLRLTANGMLIGTPFYMSPEGLRGEEMTPSSDQYSLAVVMYECATGTNPFGATTFAEIFRLIGAGQYPPPSAVQPQVSKRLERIIMRAMSFDPSLRFKDLREMGRELLMLAGQRTRITWSLSFGELERPKASGANNWKVPERPSLSAPPTDDANRPRRNLKLLALPLLLLAVVLIVGFSGALSSRRNAHSQPPAYAAAVLSPATQPRANASELNLPPTAPPLPLEAAVTRVQPKAGRRQVSARRERSSSSAQIVKSDGADPDWAIPAASAATQGVPGQPRVQIGVGANGAPIFD